MFTPSDLDLLKSHGISVSSAESQIDLLRKGVPFVELDRPCLVNDGIRSLSRDKMIQCLDEARDAIDRYEIMKFVPASGAATRMFKALFEAMEGKESDLSNQFFNQLENFAFYEELVDKWVSLGNMRSDIKKHEHRVAVLELLLSETGLGYGDSPKALINFHRYPHDPVNPVRKACEEHLSEAAQYAVNEDGIASIHYTASGHYLPGLMNFMQSIVEKYEDRYQVSFDLSYSIQEPHTNTLALDEDGDAFRKSDGNLLFRPGGHGALLENLNRLEADVVFIKNIDNVCHESRQESTTYWKRILLGYLVDLASRTHHYIEKLIAGNTDILDEVRQYMSGRLWIDLKGDETVQKLIALLNRPIRVCGMVKNEGEPGGGPFWVNTDGRISPQIVEKAQIDTSNAEQESILANSTHFNPVDLVCFIRDYKGESFDLFKFRDMNTSFIAEKTLDGRPLKALELPGLWNGAMADWITVFVEVPLSTFNPVKTVNDLLKAAHRPV